MIITLKKADFSQNNIGNVFSKRLFFAEQNLIDGFRTETGSVTVSGGHKHFELTASEINSITLTPLCNGLRDTLYYIIHVAADGVVSPYIPLTPVTAGVPITIDLSEARDGILYVNVYADGKYDNGVSYEYPKSLVVNYKKSNNKDFSTEEVFVFSEASTKVTGCYIAVDGTKITNATHNYCSVPAEGIQSITISPTKAGAINTLYYIVHVDENNVAHPYCHLKESIGSSLTIPFNGTAKGTIFFNEFIDNNNAGYEYVTQVIIKR
jgi:hypothetical protein